MRTARLKALQGTAYYHCVSRVVGRAFVFGDAEKEAFVRLMRAYEEFCGVRIVTFCYLDNHFHALVEVPQRPEVLPEDEEIFRRLSLVSSKAAVMETRLLLNALIAEGNHEMASALREKIYARMWDVSTFMQQLKQRFTQYFNKKHNRVGTLWEERFKSVLVEGAGAALATMAAYIDLNPVRAGIVQDPKDYRWSGYGEAVAGQERAIAGLKAIFGYFGMEESTDKEALKRYRVWVYEEGQEIKPDPASGSAGRRGIDLEKVDAVVNSGGELTRGQLLRTKVRYFLDGAVLGSREFVREFIDQRRAATGWQRKTGETPMKGGDWGGLCTLRALRQKVIG